MKIRNILLLVTAAIATTGCNSGNNTNSGTNTNTDAGSKTDSGSSSHQDSHTDNTPTKATVNAHTLSDTNPPININAAGDIVNEATWDSFRYASDTKFKNHYNFTYTSYSGGMYSTQKFTKNGYSIQSSTGNLYYERKSGSTFYSYINSTEGVLRTETTFDLQGTATYRIKQTIYEHMKDFENYYYDDYDGTYRYLGSGFGYAVRFQGGYLTYVFASVAGAIFELKDSFQTTIDIPKSYYYK